jgi:hypothetical protein
LRLDAYPDRHQREPCAAFQFRRRAVMAAAGVSEALAPKIED